MNVTVLGTTGCGSPELANIHRENSSLRLMIYFYNLDTVENEDHSIFAGLAAEKKKLELIKELHI